MTTKLAFLLMLGLTAVALAQTPPPQTPPGPMIPGGPGRIQPQNQEPTLQGEAKLRWVCKQLKLTPEQMQQADSLIAVYNAEVEDQKKNVKDLLNQIQDLASQIRQAENEGNKAKVEELRTQMRDLTPGRKAEKNFYESLAQMLTPEQKARLDLVRQRADTGGVDATFRPIYVLRAARKANLTPEQSQKLENLLDEYRTNITAKRPANAEETQARVDKLAADVRAILTPEQTQVYDKQLNELKETMPAPTQFDWPSKPPAAPAPAAPTTQPAARPPNP